MDSADGRENEPVSAQNRLQNEVVMLRTRVHHLEEQVEAYREAMSRMDQDFAVARAAIERLSRYMVLIGAGCSGEAVRRRMAGDANAQGCT